MATTAGNITKQLRTLVNSVPKKYLSINTKKPRNITRRGRYIYNNSINIIDKIKYNGVVFVETKKGNDRITAYNGGKNSAYAIYADAGNDKINIHGGSVVIVDAGSGNDTVNIYGGKSVGLIAGNGNDIITIKGGTTIAVDSGSGNDTIYVKGGSTVGIIAGSGNDTINLQKGNQRFISADAGNDKINILAGSNHVIATGTGHDIIKISAGSKHIITGDSGNDKIYLNKGTGNGAIINGGAGNDTIYISKGSNHTIYSGSGRDTINVTGGNRQNLYLGSGKNSINISAANTYIEQQSSKSTDIITINWKSNIGKTVIDTVSKNSGYKDQLIIKGANSNDFKFIYGTESHILAIAPSTDSQKYIAINGWWYNDAFSKITFDDKSLSYSDVYDKSTWVLK